MLSDNGSSPKADATSSVRKKYVDKRNWREYNEKLVLRGCVLLDPDFLPLMKQDLETINKNKVGRPFKYPDRLFNFLGSLYTTYHFHYRQLQGYCIFLHSFIPEMPIPDYSTIAKRFSSLQSPYEETLHNLDEEIEITIDSSGTKVTNRGEWIRKTHKGTKRKGWIKIHFAVDVKSKKTTAFEVTTEKKGDNPYFQSLVCHTVQAVGNSVVTGIKADGSYDTFETFEFCDALGIDPAIRIRDNACPYSVYKGLDPPRLKYVREYQRSYDDWKRNHNYGMRWMNETVFSSHKRIFGEYVNAKKFENMKKEIAMRVYAYNKMLDVPYNA